MDHWIKILPLTYALLASCSPLVIRSDQIATAEPKILIPKTIVHTKPLGESGLITRDLFRSFWILPASDHDELRVGIIPSSKTVRLSAAKDFVIRIYGEHESWDVASPGGVVWTFEFNSFVRPPVLRHLVTVFESDVKDAADLPKGWIEKYVGLGFENTQWLGPPKMDAWNDNKELKRFFLTLAIEEDRKSADATCLQVTQKTKSACKVITRMDLPHIAQGSFRASSSNFMKAFEGVIEIIPSKKDAIQIFDVKTSLLSDQTETLVYGPKVFVAPNLEGELSVVQATTLGEYLKSVVPSEIFPNGPIEALKAQAVIARTYLYQSKLHYSDKPFLTCASTLCQVYLGEKTKNQSREITRAVEQTANEVLKESIRGRFAETFYHGASGGKTELKQWVLGGSPKPYLASTNDILEGDTLINLQDNREAERFITDNVPTYCGVSRFSKNIRWSERLDQDDLQKVLEKLNAKAPLYSVEVVERGFSGRATQIKLATGSGEKTVKGELKIRSLFGGLPSSLIIFQTDPTAEGTIRTLTIMGRGSGHGVGLSQLGAIGRAIEGQSYRQILSAYYPGTILSLIQP